MAKAPKKYIVTCTKGSFTTRTYKTSPMTLPELVEYHQYTLECGRSWQHEKGNKKINCNPKTIKSLITNLNNAVNNSAANGYAATDYDYEEYVEETA